MRNAIFAATLAAGVLSLSSGAFATMAGHMPAAFGPVVEMEMKAGEMKGHMMHVQVIDDETGAKYVVLPMEEAEAIFGPITAAPMHYAGK